MAKVGKVKLKTHRGANKRFKITATGKIVVKGAGVRHILTKKSSKLKRQSRRKLIVNLSDAKKIRRALPYAF